MSYLTVLGHSNIDVQLNVAAMPGGGRSSPVSDRRTVYGGTANNIARHAAGMGVPVRLWSRVGGDFPPEWKVGLEDDGVELHFDQADRTPTCYILTVPDGEQAYCMDQGAMTPPYEVPAAAWEGSAWLHICTGDPDSYLPVARAAKDAGLKIAFSPTLGGNRVDPEIAAQVAELTAEAQRRARADHLGDDVGHPVEHDAREVGRGDLPITQGQARQMATSMSWVKSSARPGSCS